MLQKLILFLIRIYGYFLSPSCWGCCRFYPTCSKYAQQAIQQFGVSKGLWLSTKRLARCHPWCDGGYDPIPIDKQINCSH